jgi:hypothetical protein
MVGRRTGREEQEDRSRDWDSQGVSGREELERGIGSDEATGATKRRRGRGGGHREGKARGVGLGWGVGVSGGREGGETGRVSHGEGQ